MAQQPDIAAALRYGPETQSAIRRSQYLVDALRAMQADGGKNIQSGGELAAKLLATALLSRSSEKARTDMSAAVKADQQSEADRILAGFAPTKGQIPAEQGQDSGRLAAALSGQPDTAPQAVASPGPVGVASLPNAAPAPTPRPQPSGFAGGLKGVEQSLREKIGNFTVTSGLRSPERNAAVGGAPNSHHLSGQAMDLVPPPGMSMAELEQRLRQTGMPFRELINEKDHVHVAWSGDGPPPVPQASPIPAQPLPAPTAPSQVPAAGAPPPAPAGSTPGALPPQAAPGVTLLPPTQQEIARAKALLSDPRTFEQGRAYALELQERAITPQKSETVTINGLPFARNPWTNELAPVGVPDAARTQLRTAQDAGIATAPQGLYVQQDPLGNLKEAPGAPPQGYNAVAGQGYAPIRGGPEDPMRVQAPPPNYQFNGQGGYDPIRGSQADPSSPKNILEGTASIRGEMQTMLQDATKLRRNYEAVNSGYAQQNGTGDIAIINGIQRMIDEGVVREGDVALQLRANGIEGTLGSWLGFVKSEGQFTPEIRAKLKRTADSLYGGVNDVYRQRVQGYKSIAEKSYGPGAFDYVLPPETAAAFGWERGAAKPGAPPPPNPAGSMTPGTREAAIEEARKRGLIK